MARPNVSRRMIELKEMEAVIGGEEVLPPMDREPEGGGEGGGGGDASFDRTCTKVHGKYCTDWTNSEGSGTECDSDLDELNGWIMARCVNWRAIINK